MDEPSLTVSAVSEPEVAVDSRPNPAPHNLKRNTARGALVSTCGQATNFALRTVSMVILARLLTPADFGLVGMAAACTGFLTLVQDVGLSMATVQRTSITREQISTLFWVNFVVGGILAGLCAVVSPAVAAFYNEPRLFWVTLVFGMSFLFSGATAQHRAMLQRNMRFAALTAIDISALFISIVLGIATAVAGIGYWALVTMALSLPAATALGVWVTDFWIPGPPRRRVGVRSMLRYGGTVTLNGIVVYIAYNVDKILLGRFWGAETLGIYGRAYQLINLPTANLNTSIGSVAIPALSRLQNDPVRLRSYFLKGYGLFLAMVMPITMGCALFAEDIIRVFLGAKWGAAAPVFRLLAPTILTFSLINPLGWLMLASGRAMRSLKIAILLAPVVILGYVAGLGYGPNGVAAGFSFSTVLLAIPIIVWATRGTQITATDVLGVFMRPFGSILIGGGAALAGWSFIRFLDSPLLRLAAANTILFGVYGIMLWFVMGQKDVYLGLIRDIGIWPSAGRKKQRDATNVGMPKPQISE